jgi:hypothetical protein
MCRHKLIRIDTDTLPLHIRFISSPPHKFIFLCWINWNLGSFTHILHYWRTPQTHKSREGVAPSSRCRHSCCYWCRRCRLGPITWLGGCRVLGGIVSDPKRPLKVLVPWILSIGCRPRLRARGADKQRAKTKLQFNME